MSCGEVKERRLKAKINVKMVQTNIKIRQRRSYKELTEVPGSNQDLFCVVSTKAVESNVSSSC